MEKKPNLEWTEKDLRDAQNNLNDGLLLAKRIVRLLDGDDLRGTEPAIVFALLFVARMRSDAAVPDKEDFTDMARIAAGYLELREKKGREPDHG